MYHVKKIQVSDLTAEIFGKFELKPGFMNAVDLFIQGKIKFPYHLISGKFYIKFTKEDELVCIVNDVFGSYRIYIQNNALLTTFPENHYENDEPQIALLKYKGYCQGEKTLDQSILKVPPCSAYQDGEFKEQLPEIIEMSARNYANSVVEMISKINEQKIGVAFSGGSDSLFLVRLLLSSGKTPVLYHFITDTMDKANNEDSEKSQKLAKLLKLDLHTIFISIEDRKDYLSEYGSHWKNDITDAFLNIRCFIKKIEELGEVNVLITGQNADTFINHGITRKLNFLDIYQLISHKIIFRKLYEKNKTSILSKLFLLPLYLFLVDRSIRGSWSKIPSSMSEFVMASISENYYLPTLNGHKYENFFDNDKIDYFQWYFLNKLNNHIGGNHSIAWSDDRSFTKLTTLMPFSSIPYLCFSSSEFKSLRNIFWPKQKLNRVLKMIEGN